MPSFNFRLLRYKLIFAIFVWLLVQSTNTASAPARGSLTYVLENMVIPGRYMPIPLLPNSTRTLVTKNIRNTLNYINKILLMGKSVVFHQENNIKC